MHRLPRSQNLLHGLNLAYQGRWLYFGLSLFAHADLYGQAASTATSKSLTGGDIIRHAGRRTHTDSVCIELTQHMTTVANTGLQSILRSYTLLGSNALIHR
ncbi:hypothetical protein A0H81_05806 [Grifola frondosa]|uniref:Uncharacterized protein n=1 Tax=Grifola frondosa TaxID=5627 RepID=A0A1C7MD75_GRIFR|nr:hypothetical protein A0H81_05806 [Grifola frondosa]